jgi:hypothetical protein
MSHDHSSSRPPFYSQIDVSSGAAYPTSVGSRVLELEQIRLLRELVAAQDRQNELLEELVNQFGAAQKQRASELGSGSRPIRTSRRTAARRPRPWAGCRPSSSKA